MLQKYKLPIILSVTIIFLFLIYTNSTTRHWVYYKMIGMIVPNNIENIEIDSSLLYQNYIILDARTNEEFKVSHIRSAKWIGDDSLALQRANFEIGKREPRYLIYCSIGYRSQLIGQRLKDSLGFSIENLQGGLFGWNQKRFPLVDSLGNSTEKVHSYSFMWSFWKD